LALRAGSTTGGGVEVRGRARAGRVGVAAAVYGFRVDVFGGGNQDGGRVGGAHHFFFVRRGGRVGAEDGQRGRVGVGHRVWYVGGTNEARQRARRGCLGGDAAAGDRRRCVLVDILGACRWWSLHELVGRRRLQGVGFGLRRPRTRPRCQQSSQRLGNITPACSVGRGGTLGAADAAQEAADVAWSRRGPSLCNGGHNGWCASGRMGPGGAHVREGGGIVQRAAPPPF